jgi:shikimate dehydrogenase
MNTTLIENQINHDHLDKFAAIIGENPSNGARSPLLWNAAFNEYGLNCSMLPLDVTNDNILDLLNDLNQDVNFIGGAIAVPYKVEVAKWLNGNITTEAKNIGAVNCLFRDKNGKLMGTNTDGEAALRSYESSYGSAAGKKVIILGTGGVAKAVAAYFLTGTGEDGKVKVVGRLDHGKSFAERLEIEWIEWDELDDNLKNVDLIINCTSIGFGDQEKLSPISNDQLRQLKKNTIVFDVVYQPLNTTLLKMAQKNNLKTLSGLKMNLEQAVYAFNYANHKEDSLITRFAMKNAQ